MSNAVDNDGYLSQGQAIVDYTIRECSYTFAQLRREDPVKHLRQWEGIYSGMRAGNLALAGFSLAAVMAGVFVGAPVLMGAGLIAVAFNGAIAKGHHETLAGIAAEEKLLAEVYPCLKLMEELEGRGVDRLELVNIYQRLVQRFTVGFGLTGQEMREVFEAEMSKAPHLKAVRDAMGVPIPLADPVIAADRALPAGDVQQFPDTQIQGEDGDEAIAALPKLSDGITQSSPAASLAAPHPTRYLIGDRLRTALITAVSGGGKDILLSNALRAFLSGHPGFRVVVMDCKDDPKEYAYYDNLPNVRVYRLNVAIASDGEVIEWVDNCLEEFVRLPEKALLICNEGTLIRAKSKRHIQVVDGLVSSGDSRQKYAWEAGQSAHTDDLGINNAARSRFRMLIVGLKGEEMQIEAVLSAKFVADSARNMNDIKTQLLRSPVNRAWSDGQRWYAMPKLTNYSGYDRDSRSMLPGFKPQGTVAKLEDLYRRSGETQGETPCIASNSADGDDTVSRFVSPGETGETDLDRVRRVGEMKRSGLNQTQILAIEWGVKPGKSQAYLDAVAEYKAIVDRHWKE